MSSIPMKIREAAEEWVNLFNKPDVRIPPYNYNTWKDHPDRINASSLGQCPLKEARKRNKEEQTSPKSRAEAYTSKHLMYEGVLDGNNVQHYLSHFLGAELEVDILSTIGGVTFAGRVDALLRDVFDEDGGKINVLIEVKRRDAPTKDTMWRRKSSVKDSENGHRHPNRSHVRHHSNTLHDCDLRAGRA